VIVESGLTTLATVEEKMLHGLIGDAPLLIEVTVA